jgi:hypothetical protein
MTNSQKSKEAFELVEVRAEGGTGWLRFGVEMKGEVAVDGSYRQLTALQKNSLDAICSAIEEFGAAKCDCISYGNAGCAIEVMMRIREMQGDGVKNVLTGGGLNPFVWCSVDKDGVATERLPEHFSQSVIL